MFCALILLLLSSCLAVQYEGYSADGPRSIGELLGLIYPNGDAPTFLRLPGPAELAISHNSTTAWRLEQLNISPYPLTPGTNYFELVSHLVEDVPEGALLKAKLVHKWETVFEGSFGLCPYLEYFKLACPVAKDSWSRVLRRGLIVPETVGTGRYSFSAELTTPDHALLLSMVGLIDVESGLSDVVEHDEL